MSEPNAMQDMQARWLPRQDAVDVAVAALKACPEADLAAIPMYQPGKTYAIWEVGQVVATVIGVVFLGVNGFKSWDGRVRSYAWARNAAAQVAIEILGDDPGTVGWATITRDGHAAVFEDFPRESHA